MLTFILILGFLSIAICPMAFALHAEVKLKSNDQKKISFWLGFIPGACLFILYAVLKPDHPPVIPSQACGVIQFYKAYQTRGSKKEVVTILFDQAKYHRHLSFEASLDRLQKGQHVCFEYLDKFQYPHLPASKILKWTE